MTLQDVIKRGLELGLEAVEVYACISESNTLKLDEGKLESYNIKEIFGVSIRGLYQGKMGYVYTETLEENEVEEILHQLVENTKLLDMTEPEFMYEGGASYESVPVVESDYKEHSTAEKIDLLKKLEKETLATSDKIKKIGYCEYDEVSKEINILNSKGLNLNKKYSYVEAFVGALAEENDQTVMGYSVDVNFKLNDLDTNKIVKEASEMAVSQLGAGSVNSGRYPVVLKRDVATPILAAFSSIFEGSSALLKTTILTDKIGQKVFGDNITIYDDPFYSDSLIKVAFDDEGVPCRTKKIVEKGVFKGFLHNLKTANYFNVEPTGNGFKEGVAGKIGTGPTNMFIEPGNLTKDEIISTVEKGIFVTDVNGLHAGLNPISGDFNVQASGFMIENGKIANPVTLFVISGNFYEMMNNVDLIGNDIEKRFNEIASPTLKIKELAISGK